MKMTLILSAVLLIVAARAHGGEIELFSLEQRFLPYTQVDNRSATEVQPEFTRAKMSLPPVLFRERNGVLGTSIAFENLHFNYRNWDALGDSARIDTLHSVQVSLFYMQPLRTPHWSLRTFLAPSLNSDFSAVTWAAFHLQGGVIFEKAVKATKFGLGVVVVDNYGRTMPFPAVSFETLLAGHHRISMRAPTQLSWFYVPNERWEAGLAMRINGGNYRLEEDGVFKGKTVRYSLGTFGPSLLMKLNSFLSMSLDAGTVFRHKFGVYDNRTEVRDFDLRNSYFASAGFRLRLNRE
jgi:hypothetical protein